MGQYYKIIILADNEDIETLPEVIRMAISPYTYDNGAKLMEHSYVGNSLVNLVEYLLSREGPYYKSRIVWAGDYADDEPGDQNLYHQADNNAWLIFEQPSKFDNNKYQFVVNHSKKEYIDKSKCQAADESGLRVHPLPLLVAEGNGRGGGDYSGHNEDMCGSWARDIITVEKERPAGFTELECGFLSE